MIMGTTTRERTLTRSCQTKQRGYVLFTMAASMIAIFAFVGLVVDVGNAELVRRQAQAAADAGAKAAALEIGADATSSIATAAKQDTSNNGFTDAPNSSACTSTPVADGCVKVTVNHPPTSGSYSSNNSYAEVIVTKTVSTYFMGIVGYPTMTISARSVGGTGTAGGCIYALDPSAQDAVLASPA